MKLKHIESYLQNINGFAKPKLSLEQYITTPHIAAHMLHTIDANYDDIDEKVVADLGCGCGMLTIGCSMLQCGHCIGIDIDNEALDICRGNIENFTEDDEITNIDLVQLDVQNINPGDQRWLDKVDTVIMNPPFGTKNNEGIDMHFLRVGLTMAQNAVYSLHKSSTREYVVKECKRMGVTASVEAELNFNLDKSYKVHKRKSVDIQVDFMRCTFDDKELFIDRMRKLLKEKQESLPSV